MEPEMTMNLSATDVLIVGAGPTGLMLANQLARRGIQPLIIDKNSGPSTRTKALAVHARTLEIYAHLGLVERALQRGACMAAANMWINGKKAARVPLGDIGRDLSPYPFVLVLGQDENERLLGESLHKFGVEVKWSTELVAIVQKPDHATASIKQSDGSTRDITAKWIAGCDGPHSAVRALNGIDFVGAPYEHVFFVADTTVTGPMVPNELNVFLWRDGFHLFFPMRGNNHWRIVGILPRDLRVTDDLAFAAVVPSIRQHVSQALAIHECRWFSTYRIHHRRAARFRDRRCFLLGDAAHIHSPVGGQGMNTGLQDAHNLGWKMSLVLSGRAGESLLDSYASERVPVAERLLKTTDRAFSLIVSDRWLAGIFRTKVLAKILAFAMTVDRIRKLAFFTISQIGIHYRGSPLSETQADLPKDAPRAGDRFPWLRVKCSVDGPVEDLFSKLDDTRFNLLVIGQSSVPQDFPGVSDLVRIHHIPGGDTNDQELARAGVPQPSCYLLRSDGHVGLAGSRVEPSAVNRYLVERLGLQPAGNTGERGERISRLP